MSRSEHATLEQALGHRFRDRALLGQALTHRSFGSPHNERLEYLGDSILDAAISTLLYRRFPSLSEGDLSRLRASLVRQDSLAVLARKLDLGAELRLGEGEIKSGGASRASILADAFEALLGAVFLDDGFERAFGVIERLYEDRIAQIDPANTVKDPKTALQEWLQGRKHALPHYEIKAVSGQAHEQQFVAVCRLPGMNLETEGCGASRRAAEQSAASAALRRIGAA